MELKSILLIILTHLNIPLINDDTVFTEVIADMISKKFIYSNRSKHRNQFIIFLL